MSTPEGWIVTLSGKEYATWPYVLNEAHQIGLKAIETQLVQIPAPENQHTAIVRATARFEDGKEFTAYGDASPANVNNRIATALIRMAETRGKGRALRDACNIGMTLAEELPPEERDGERAGGNGAASAAGAPPRPPAQSRPERPAAVANSRPAGGDPNRQGGPAAVCSCGKPMTQKMVDDAQRQVKLTVCPTCLKELIANVVGVS